MNIHFVRGQNQSKAYDFPIKPGTKEWTNLKNNKQKVDICQIPNEQLKLLSTSELLESCLNYPLLPDIFAFNNIQDGFEKFKMDFNGINELFVRNDISNVLISMYKSLSPLDYNDNLSLIRKGEFSVNISLIEIFCSQHEVLIQLDFKEKQNLVSELLNKYNKKSKSEIYGRLSFRTLAFCLANILQSENFIASSSNDTITNEILMFETKGGRITNDIFSNIISLSKQFKNN